jgi:hypothetical protein
VRLVVALLFGIALGFGGGYAVFEQPWETGLSRAEIESRLLRQERAEGREADRTDCLRRQGSDTEWLCTVTYALDARVPESMLTFEARVSGDSVTFTSRG